MSKSRNDRQQDKQLSFNVNLDVNFERMVDAYFCCPMDMKGGRKEFFSKPKLKQKPGESVKTENVKIVWAKPLKTSNNSNLRDDGTHHQERIDTFKKLREDKTIDTRFLNIPIYVGPNGTQAFHYAVGKDLGAALGNGQQDSTLKGGAVELRLNLLQLIEQFLYAVLQLHKANLVHRDISKNNILVYSEDSGTSQTHFIKLSDLDDVSAPNKNKKIIGQHQENPYKAKMKAYQPRMEDSEALKDDDFSKLNIAADCWDAGYTIHQLLSDFGGIITHDKMQELKLIAKKLMEAEEEKQYTIEKAYTEWAFYRSFRLAEKETKEEKRGEEGQKAGGSLSRPTIPFAHISTKAGEAEATPESLLLPEKICNVYNIAQQLQGEVAEYSRRATEDKKQDNEKVIKDDEKVINTSRKLLAEAKKADSKNIKPERAAAFVRNMQEKAKSVLRFFSSSVIEKLSRDDLIKLVEKTREEYEKVNNLSATRRGRGSTFFHFGKVGLDNVDDLLKKLRNISPNNQQEAIRQVQHHLNRLRYGRNAPTSFKTLLRKNLDNYVGLPVEQWKLGPETPKGEVTSNVNPIGLKYYGGKR